MHAGKNGQTILVAEDELEVRNYLEMALKCQGYTVEVAEDGEEVIAILQSSAHRIAAVLLDIMMPRKDGFETLKEIRSNHKDLPVIMVSGVSHPVNVVEAMKNGATDFIGKPANHEELQKVIKSALERRQTFTYGEPEPAAEPAARQMVCGSTPYMKELYSLLPHISWAEAPVLIQGETGSGKEVLAREIYVRSRRAKKPFLKLNCAALPSELVESELFGYERGAFTGAFQKKPGMFELADGGTLLLDEIGDMDFKLQAKLLQVLQDQEFQRLGGKETVKVDVRVIAATHRDLEKAIGERSFREDLYYRLNVITLVVPSLRDRKEDLVPLAEFLLKKHATPGVPAPAISPALKQALVAHAWPGNVRELENVIRKLVILKDPETVARDLRTKATHKASVESISRSQGQPESSGTDATILEQVSKAKQNAERTAIVAALNSTHWNRKKAAVLLKIDYKALLYKMKKLSIEDKMVIFPQGGMVDEEEAACLESTARSAMERRVTA